MKKQKVRYDVISPDGFSIHFANTYKTEDDAKLALNEWAKRFEAQGYYSSNNGRIDLNELEQNCRIVKYNI